MIPKRWQKSSRLSIFTVALTAFIALGALGNRDARAQSSTLPLDFPDVVIFATNSARLGNNSRVLEGHVVVNNAATGATLSTGFELRVGAGVLTPTGFSIVGDTIRVDTGAIVSGSAFFNGLTNFGTISGTQNTFPAPPPSPFPIFTPLPQFKTGTAGSTNVTVNKNAVQTITAGNYRDIKLQPNSQTGPGHLQRSLDQHGC